MPRRGPGSNQHRDRPARPAAHATPEQVGRARTALHAAGHDDDSDVEGQPDGSTVDVPAGRTMMFRNGQGLLHHDEGPAVTHADGTRIWYQNGLPHRAGGPAVERADGRVEHWQHGCRHRDGGPAVIYPDGTASWWQNGLRHRDGGPALEHADGTKEWWDNGRKHRDDGPAVTYPNGNQEWWQNGNNVGRP